MDATQQHKIATVLSDSATILRNLASERDKLAAANAELNAKIAQFELRTRAEKVAMTMHQKGINTDTSIEDLVANLEKAAGDGKLATIETALDMVAPDMGQKIASIHDNPAMSGGSSDFERYILGGIG